MPRLTRGETVFLAFVLVFTLVPAAGGLLRLLELSGGTALLPANPRAAGGTTIVVIHIVSSLVFSPVGAAQFLPTIRRSKAALHRGLGRIVAMAGTGSALSGFWMTAVFPFPADLQGPLLFGARILVGSAMLFLIVGAVQKVRSGDVRTHGAWMIRAFALGHGASTQAVFGLAYAVALGAEAVGFERDVMMAAAWLLNVLIAEVIIRRTLPRRVSAPRFGLQVHPTAPAR